MPTLPVQEEKSERAKVEPKTSQVGSPVSTQLKDITAIVTLGTGLLAALGSFVDKLSDLLPFLANFSKSTLLAFSASCFFLAYLVQRKRLRRKPVLVNPELLDLTSKGWIVGREEDVKNIVRLLREVELLWLVGESGCGKSTLLQLGLMPELKQSHYKLPIYIDSYGSDWSVGPEQALNQALRVALRDAEANSVQVADCDRVELLSAVQRETGRAPLLIFDQFDDYYLRYRSEFVNSQGGIISATELSVRNGFWKQIANLLGQHKLQCVFASRDDTSVALEVVRYANPQIYPLSRLRAGYVTGLLSEFTSSGAIENADYGWPELQSRLAADLEATGSVLPIQMHIAVSSLGVLPQLTISEYRRRGGLRGLEATYIGYHVAEAARHSMLTESSVRKLLIEMIDPVAKKTVPITSAQLVEKLADKRTNVEAALTYLESRQILRSRVDDKTGSVVWLLYHDYLSGAVLELQRRLNQWQAYLRDSAASFRSARGLVDSWRTLLSPLTQIRILAQRVRGQLTYGEDRQFAMLSTVKLILNYLTCPSLLQW